MEDKNKVIPKAQDRLDILKKIEEYEKNGWFDQDVENDPPSRTLMPNEVDYLEKKLKNKIGSKYAYFLARKFMNKMIKDKKLIVKEIKGIDNWQKLKTGAVITCNHFNAMDSFAMQLAFDNAKQKKKKMYKVIREGNYTNFPGFYGMLFRHCHTLPLSSNMQTMKNFLTSVDTILKRGDYVLVYPEQSMWWNYKKPKPLKNGAFKFAIKSNVPILPCFITLQDSDIIGDDGFYIQEYTIHIFEPLYPNPNLNKLQQAEDLLNRNYKLWKECYESTYNTKLKYLSKKEVH